MEFVLSHKAGSMGHGEGGSVDQGGGGVASQVQADVRLSCTSIRGEGAWHCANATPPPP